MSDKWKKKLLKMLSISVLFSFHTKSIHGQDYHTTIKENLNSNEIKRSYSENSIIKLNDNIYQIEMKLVDNKYNYLGILNFNFKIQNNSIDSATLSTKELEKIEIEISKTLKEDITKDTIMKFFKYDKSKNQYELDLVLKLPNYDDLFVGKAIFKHCQEMN